MCDAEVMLELATASVYPAMGCALLGLGLVGLGVRALRLGDGRRSWPAWALTYLHVFRGVVVGLCLIGVAWGWSAHIGWLLAASVCIGVGELLESSYYLVVLEWGRCSGRMSTGFAPDGTHRGCFNS
jgi:hypothetical protein